MLLNNNNNEAVVAGQQQVVFRQSRPAKPSRNNNKKSSAGGGTSAARNSWSFQTPEALLVQAGINTKVENIYADPETLMMLNGNTNSEMKSVSRSRLRQRSVSNLTAASLAGTRANREHSSNRNAHQQNGTVSAKGVDYIRMRPAAVEPPQIIQDRSEYGNPDGSSAHSTAEREAAAGLTCINNKEVYEVIHQNQANHLIQSSEGEAPTLLVRSVSGQQHTNVVPTTRGSPREVAVPAVRKPHTAAAGSGPIKTEWTFLPSPTAPPTDPPSLQREINSKPEESSTVRKGLVWMMRDRLFSRYHERFCILTRNYLHCFKKGTEGSLTHMGNFLFKVSLADVMAVQWLDKRGTAIVCLTLAKEGRLLVKTSLDLQGWFEDFQSCVKETIGRRQTLLLAPKNSSSAGTPSPPISARHRQQYVVQPVVRDRSLAARNRSTNRYSLMSDHEVKMTGMSATSGAASEGPDNGNPSGILAGQPLSLCYTVPAQMTSSTPPPPPTTTTTTTTQAGPPPVPVPYRERSVSFDRSRASKAERDAKRRSYFPSNHVTQV